MSRRIEIELTSKRADGTWTWRAAGAREPKGVVEDGLVPAGVAVNDVLRAEIESDLDGTRILSMVPPKAKAARSGLLELLPSEKPFQPVTSVLAKKGRGGDSRRSGRDDRPRKDGEGRDARGPRRDGDRPRRDGDRPRRPRFETPAEMPQRPRPTRLKAGRAHVSQVLASLPEAQRAIAERVLQGGIPAVRSAIADQNKTAKAEGREQIPVEGLVSIAEQLLPKLRVAEWLDRAESSQKIIDNIDLRDLRSVVVASDDPVVVRDETTRTLAASLKQALVKRQEVETSNWLEDIAKATEIGRVVRALNMSSQPPKAGIVFPAELAVALAAKTTESLTADAPSERWIAVLEAAAFSPVRASVNPTAVPNVITDDLTKTVTRLAPLMPQLAMLFGISFDPKAPAPRPIRAARPVKKAAPKRKAADVREKNGSRSESRGQSRSTDTPDVAEETSAPTPAAATEAESTAPTGDAPSDVLAAPAESPVDTAADASSEA